MKITSSPQRIPLNGKTLMKIATVTAAIWPIALSGLMCEAITPALTRIRRHFAIYFLRHGGSLNENTARWQAGFRLIRSPRSSLISAKPDGAGAALRPWTAKGEQCSLLTHIAMTEGVSWCMRMKSSLRFVELEAPISGMSRYSLRRIVPVRPHLIFPA